MSAPAHRTGTAVPRLLDTDDLSASDLAIVLELSERSDLPRVLDGRGVSLIFEKPSARTRNATEMAVVQLGGHPVSVRNEEVGLDVRETTEDVTRTLAGYHSVICARVFAHTKLERMAAVSSVPIVNLLSDAAHPLQTLADLLTIRQRFGRLGGVTVAWVGDFSNVARSLALGCALSGASFRFAGPDGYGPTEADMARIEALGGTVEVATEPADAVADADVVTTDAWYSMGQEAEKEVRRTVFAPYTVDGPLMGKAASHAIFLHCLPAHRGDEATDEVLDGPQSAIWPQAVNRMHTARGALAFLLGVR